MKRPELRVESEVYKGKRFAVPSAGLRLGRSSSNDIPIRDEELSRNHCLFERSGESGIRITDLASANGTFVNEKRLGAEAVELKVGDVIRVGESFITVVGEGTGRVDFDLGLGSTIKENGEAPKKGVEGDHSQKPRSPIANVLWGVVGVMFAAVLYFAWQSAEVPAAKTEEIVPVKASLVEMRYEKVTADSETIFRYYMSLTADGALHVVIDDLSGEGRHINRSVPLKDAARERLMEILSDEGLQSLDREYVGPDEEPPKLSSWSLRFYTTADRRSVRIVNTPEPDAFRRVREKLEAFSMNELGIRALQYSREKLLEMAHAAADTGRMKWEDRDVEYGNLHASICAYREAISCLETINPKPLEHDEYVAARERAEQELDKRYKDQRFVAEQATSTGDWEMAKNELRTLCEMIPDREDERNREAATKLIDVEKRLRKGGAR